MQEKGGGGPISIIHHSQVINSNKVQAALKIKDCNLSKPLITFFVWGFLETIKAISHINNFQNEVVTSVKDSQKCQNSLIKLTFLCLWATKFV